MTKKPSVLDKLNALKSTLTWVRVTAGLTSFSAVEMSTNGKYARIPSSYGQALMEGEPEVGCRLNDSGPWQSIICVKYGDYIYWFYYADNTTTTVPSRWEVGA